MNPTAEQKQNQNIKWTMNDEVMIMIIQVGKLNDVMVKLYQFL